MGKDGLQRDETCEINYDGGVGRASNDLSLHTIHTLDSRIDPSHTHGWWQIASWPGGMF